jgi:hypothetical protein
MGAAVRAYTSWPMLPAEHRMLADTTRQFARTELVPIAAKLVRVLDSI